MIITIKNNCKCPAASVNMQFIRMINNNNKNNNKSNNTNNKNNNQSSNVAASSTTTINSGAPANVKTSYSQQQQHQQPQLTSLSATQPNTSTVSPASPSVSLPPLKKRTVVVKQSVPPPVPPRGSPRSKSKSNRYATRPTSSTSSTIIASKQLQKLSKLEPSGSQKVKEWLKTVRDGSFEHGDDDLKPVPSVASQTKILSNSNSNSQENSDEAFQFKSVRAIIENFARLEPDCSPKKSRSFCSRDKVSDSSLVRSRIENYNSLERGRNRIVHKDKIQLMSNTLRSDAGTDSGIDITRDINSRKLDILQKLGGNYDGYSSQNFNSDIANENIARLMTQFSLEGEFV